MAWEAVQRLSQSTGKNFHHTVSVGVVVDRRGFTRRPDEDKLESTISTKPVINITIEPPSHTKLLFPFPRSTRFRV